jgi:geranylgeranyl diphosphate synthase type II
MDALAYIAERSPWVDAALDALLPPATAAPERLHAAMRHLVFPGGKRLRPALAFAGAEAAGADPRRATPMAAAVELVHTYSLVHDDLPCMDDDDERRGRPTVHVVFGEALAVLAGDALQACAFEALTTREAHAAAGAEALSAAVARLSRAIGAAGLVGGQVDDLGFESGHTDEAAVVSIHRRKTAALIQAAVAGGGILAGAEPDLVGRLERYGEAVGVAFQVADDLLDADEDEGCSLLPVLGIEGARARAEQLAEAALRELEGLGERAEPLRELARFAVRRKS